MDSHCARTLQLLCQQPGWHLINIHFPGLGCHYTVDRIAYRQDLANVVLLKVEVTAGEEWLLFLFQ